VDELVLRWREQVIIAIDPGLRLSGHRDLSAVTAIEVPPSLV
jgi:hypothetical protein